MKKDELMALKFKDSLRVCYEDLEPYLMAELNQLRDELISLPDDAKEKEILPLYVNCINALNRIDKSETPKSRIETDEREGLCDVLYEMGGIVGLDRETDYVCEWRDW